MPENLPRLSSLTRRPRQSQEQGVEPRSLSVIEGGRSERRRIAGVEVVLSDAETAEAVGCLRVLEEDTHLVLSAPPEIPEQDPVPLRVLTEALEAAPTPVGRLVFKPGRWLAVIHDLDASPSTTPEVIASMLRQVLDHADARGHRRIALEPLGSVHGEISPAQSLGLVAEALGQRALESLERIDFIAPTERRTRMTLERKLGALTAQLSK